MYGHFVRFPKDVRKVVMDAVKLAGVRNLFETVFRM
jgi:hypothetical protein